MSDITPEKIAAAACEGADGWRASLDGGLYLTAEGNVIRLQLIRWAEDDTETVHHFRAPVVPAGEGPVVVASPTLLAAARALYRVHVVGPALSGEEFAGLVYELGEALDALTPEQVAVLAGDEQDGGDRNPACWCEHVHNGVGMQRVIEIGGCPAHDPEGESRASDTAQAEQGGAL